jgi:hypothetical protein
MAIPAAERGAHAALIATLFGVATHTRRPVDGGFAYAFPAERLGDVARFVRNERRCCPFLSFDLTLPAGRDTLVLALTGPDGTRDFLNMELSR